MVHGQVESIDFVGEVNEAEIRVGGMLLLARTAPDAELAVGSPASIALAPEHCLLVAA